MPPKRPPEGGEEPAAKKSKVDGADGKKSPRRSPRGKSPRGKSPLKAKVELKPKRAGLKRMNTMDETTREACLFLKQTGVFFLIFISEIFYNNSDKPFFLVYPMKKQILLSRSHTTPDMSLRLINI